MAKIKTNKQKELIITEKPSVAKDIIDAIGGFKTCANGDYYESDEYVCTYAVGHILRLAEPEELDAKYKKWRLSDLPLIPKEFKLCPIDTQKKRLKVIEQLLKRSDIVAVINACDAAREGELIFREIIKYFNCTKPIKRLWLQSMTKSAIRESFQNLKSGELYDGLAKASECRSYSDWLIGLNATRALTVRLNAKKQNNVAWSAGRVQTPTLTILVNRELEILSHIPKPYWKIIAKFKADNHEYEGVWFNPNFKKSLQDENLKEDRIFDKSIAEQIVKKIINQKALASEVRKEKTRNPPLLFDLTSLQREANRRFGWSAARTAAAAQRCYETHKVITYPRTASRVLPSDYKKEVEHVLSIFAEHESYSKFAVYLLDKGLHNESKVFNDEGVSDHFAIIPTGELVELSGDDAKLFDLVVKQFISAFYPPAIYEDVERITVVNEEYFKTKPPQILKYSGWLEVWGREAQLDEISSNMLPPLNLSDSSQKAEVINISTNLEEHETKPAGRISEAGLLSLMENAGSQIEEEELSQALQKAEGLGTAATRAEIIENLKIKEYVDQYLKPTLKGITLIDILKRINTEILTSPKLTAKLELQLAEVEAKKLDPNQFMNEVYKITTNIVQAIKNFDIKQIYPNKDPLGKCPRCGANVYERAWYYECEYRNENKYEKHCPFMIWKNISGRYMDRVNIEYLLKHGRTHVLSDFVSINGKAHKAYLEIIDGNVVKKNVDSQEEQQKATYSKENDDTMGVDGKTENKTDDAKYSVYSEPLALCPIHKNQACYVMETDKYFICQTLLKSRQNQDNSKSGFLLPKVICKRTISKEEVLNYINNGETDYLYNFVSKNGKKFSAKLVLQTDGNYKFEFYNKF